MLNVEHSSPGLRMVADFDEFGKTACARHERIHKVAIQRVSHGTQTFESDPVFSFAFLKLQHKLMPGSETPSYLC